MARAPVVKVNRNKVTNILKVSYGVSNGRDMDGAPTKQHACHGIQISRIYDEKQDAVGWASDAAKGNRVPGSVEFLDDEGKTVKTLEWDDAYITSYNVRYESGDHHAVEEFTLMPRVIGFGGDKIDFDWERHS